MNRYQGKRFWGFLLVVTVLMLAYLFGRPETFGALSTALGAMYGTYAIGQSATDWKKSET